MPEAVPETSDSELKKTEMLPLNVEPFGRLTGSFVFFRRQVAPHRPIREFGGHRRRGHKNHAQRQNRSRASCDATDPPYHLIPLLVSPRALTVSSSAPDGVAYVYSSVPVLARCKLSPEEARVPGTSWGARVGDGRGARLGGDGRHRQRGHPLHQLVPLGRAQRAGGDSGEGAVLPGPAEWAAVAVAGRRGRGGRFRELEVKAIRVRRQRDRAGVAGVVHQADDLMRGELARAASAACGSSCR